MTSSPRMRMVETTARLLQSQGFRQTGLQQILAESGAPRGSLYHYFPGGKDELTVAAIAFATDDVTRQLSAILQAHDTPHDALVAVIDHFAGELEATAFEKGCPIATVTLEQAAQNPTIQRACAQAYETWQEGVAAYLATHGFRDPGAAAETLLVALEGALVLCRARHDLGPLQRLKERLPALLTAEG